LNEFEFHLARLSSGDFATRRHAAEMLGEFGAAAGIKPLLQLLGDDYWQVRNTVVDSLVRIRDKTSITPLVDCLRDEDPSVRNSAMSALNEMGEDVVVPLTGLLLGDRSEDVRIFSANTLGRIRHPQAVPGLIKGLADADENVRYACAEGLGRLGAMEAVDPLIEAMGKEETWSRFAYITALGLIGDERACPVLIGLLDDEILCFPSVIALGNIGDISALHPLAGLLAKGKETSVLRAAVASLAQIEAKTAFLSKVERQGFFHSRVIEAIKGLDRPELLELLVAMATGSDEMEMKSALMMLRFVKGRIPVERLFHLLENELLEEEVRDIIVRQGPEVVPRVVAALSADDSRKSRHLVRIVGLLGTTAEVPTLSPFLDSPNPDVVCDAVKSIGMLNGAAFFGRITALLASPTEDIRIAAVGGIALLKKDGELLKKVVGLVRSENELVRWGGYRVLGFLSTVEAADILVAGLSDESELARAAAVQSLGYVGVKNREILENPDNFAAIHRLLLDESNAVRVEAALAFTRINQPKTHGLLLEMLKNEDREVRSHVIRAVGKIGIPLAAPELCALLAKEENTEQKIFICSALGRCGGRDAAYFITPLMDDPTPELAAEAIAARAMIGDSAAAEIFPYLDSESWIVQDAAIGALGALNAVQYAGAIALLMLGIKDDPEKRLLVRAGMRALAKIGGESELETVVLLLGNPAWRYEAAGALRAIRGRLRGPFDIAGISDPVTRRCACSVSLQAGGEGAARNTAACLNDAYPSVRRAAALALLSMKNPAAGEELARIKSSDPDFWVRETLKQFLFSEES